MLFNSYAFIFIFLPIAVMGFYYLARVKRDYSIIWLVFCSLSFYAYWKPAYLILILLSISINYSLGEVVSKNTLYKLKKPQRKHFLTLGVVFNLTLLGYFKYANFFVDNVNLISGSQIHLEAIILPLAISFFTFQQIAYLVDAFRGNIPHGRLLDYCLFVSFFPQLIAGPIVHHQELVPQFKSNSDKSYDVIKTNLIIGFSFFVIGLFKKTIIADSIANYVDPVYLDAAAGVGIATLSAWLATFAYAFQIYFDFSGYSDMAIGLGLMFGIHLPFNFNSPYKARNYFEFWQRWHMTFTRFMRSHVYLPLARSRRFKFPHMMALALSVILGGFWHGASMTMVLWGVLVAMIMIVNHYWHVFRRCLGHDLSQHTSVGIFLSIVVTFSAGTLSRVLFRSENMTSVEGLFYSLLGQKGSLDIPSNMTYDIYIWFVFLIVLCWFMPNTQQLFKRYDTGIDPYAFNNTHMSTRINYFVDKMVFSFKPLWLIFIGFITTFALMGIMRTQSFIYFQF